MRKNNLTLIDNAEEIRNIDQECHRLKDLDENKCDPFEDCVERFQWSITASYYMCWFTLKEQPELMHFGESCDNFANCLQNGDSTTNYDIRADDSIPFQCAMYSFCPDPCCSSKRLLLANDSCQFTDGNPCRSLNNPKCSFNKTLNRSFISVVYNEWNVSCVCQTDGYRWNSRYGQCVDHNECRHPNPCDTLTEDCINVNGKFHCSCKLKYKWSSKEEKCVENDVLVRAMKRFSGADLDGGHCTRPNNLLCLILGGVFLMEYLTNKLWLF
ncbi:complement component C1q receptor-like [Planococcus citri]|uniref:complement component C1q receptor-like n=1 Tax=Planococcus citri TaxID=170843 RepID=UPI0031F987E5